MDNRATLLVGHTRWRTRGDERINRNNHPIRAGDVIGIHNGTIYNADRLFRRLRLRRFAEVDSELLFRLADRAFRDETPDLERFKRNLALCRGQITAVLASRRRPGTVLVLKGNKPLELRIHRRHRAVLYASDPAFLDAVLADERGWRPLHARVQARESHGVLQGVVHLHRPGETGEGAVTESRMNRRESPMNPNEPPKENTTGLLRLFVLCCAQHKTKNVVIIVMLFSLDAYCRILPQVKANWMLVSRKALIFS
jgi:hypothetical protein